MEEFFYVIDGLVFGEARRMTESEAVMRNAALEGMKLRARWFRRHEFCWIDDVVV